MTDLYATILKCSVFIVVLLLGRLSWRALLKRTTYAQVLCLSVLLSSNILQASTVLQLGSSFRGMLRVGRERIEC